MKRLCLSALFALVLAVPAQAGKHKDGGVVDCTKASTNNNVCYGTNGDDTIKGNCGLESSVFGPDDVIYAKDGNDTIDACSGKDEIHGGGGDDTINVVDGHSENTRDKVYCGGGEDSVTTDPESWDYIDSTCEHVTYVDPTP